MRKPCADGLAGEGEKRMLDAMKLDEDGRVDVIVHLRETAHTLRKIRL